MLCVSQTLSKASIGDQASRNLRSGGVKVVTSSKIYKVKSIRGYLIGVMSGSFMFNIVYYIRVRWFRAILGNISKYYWVIAILNKIILIYNYLVDMLSLRLVVKFSLFFLDSFPSVFHVPLYSVLFFIVVIYFYAIFMLIAWTKT